MKKARLLVLQSGGPTAVVNATLAGVLEGAERSSRIGDVYGSRNGVDGLISADFVDLRSASRRLLRELSRLPGAALGSSRGGHGDLQHIIDVVRKHQIDSVVCIGGGGTMRFCRDLASHIADQHQDVRVVGVPKTIDNDIPLIDHSPGYGSAARFIATVARDIGLDQESVKSYHDVTLLEVLGRDAGWIAAATAVAKTNDDSVPHLILFPEVMFDEARFLKRLFEVHDRLGYVCVVVGEGVAPSASAQYLEWARRCGVASSIERSGGRSRPVCFAEGPGIGLYLSKVIKEHSRLKVRWLRPGLIMRSCSSAVSFVDRREAFLVGKRAVNAALGAAGQGTMVSIERLSSDPYKVKIGTRLLRDIGPSPSRVPGQFIDSSQFMISPAFVKYVMPLIGEPRVKHLTFPRFEAVP